MKVCLISDHHICINPRLWKEAFFYEKQGHQVVIINKWQSADLLKKDREILAGHLIEYECYLNLIPGQISKTIRFYNRLRKRLADELQKILRIGSSWAISHAPDKLIKKALSVNADHYAAHLECAFFAGRSLIKAGRRVSFDFEDWYSRDYLVSARPVKLLNSLENFAIHNGVFCTAASQSMTDALMKTYRSKKKITTIYNGFEDATMKSNFRLAENNVAVKILWFSRTIGPDRGLENLLLQLKDCLIPLSLHLLGDLAPGYEEILKSTFAYDAGHSLTIHAFIPHHELNEFISQFKIGLAIEEVINDSRDLTVTNKILQYLQCGLFVIATPTKGQLELATHFPSAVKIVDFKKPFEFQEAVSFFMDQKPIDITQTYNRFFSWKAQEEKLKILVDSL